MVNYLPYKVSFHTAVAGWLLTLIVGLSAVQPCNAQPKPRAPGRDIISSKEPLTPEQLAIIKAFADYWSNQLSAKNSTLDQVEEAKAELTRVLEKINDPQAAFRAEYSSLLVKSLDPAISNGSLHTATNAVAVVCQLGTRAALNRLLNAGTDQQLPWQIRLAAVQGCVTAVEAGGLQPKEILDAARRMRDSIKDESNAFIVRNRFEVMLAAAENPVLQPADREKILVSDLPDAVHMVLDRIKQNPGAPSPQFGSFYVVVRKLFLLQVQNKLSPQAAQSLGTNLGPDLVSALEIARQQWEAAHANPQMDRDYGNFIKGCEDLLKRLDAEVRRDVQQRPQTQLQGAWNEKKKEQFDADTKKWQDVVSQPPYAKK